MLLLWVRVVNRVAARAAKILAVRERMEQGVALLQVRRVEPLAEPAIDGGERHKPHLAAWVPLPQIGSYTITAVAADEAGNVGRSAAHTLSAGGTGHVVTVTSLASSGAVLTSTVTLRGCARLSTSGEGSVAVTVGGSTVQATLATAAESLSAWTAAITLPATEGAHSITVTPSCSGTAGTAATISLTLDRTVPTLSVTSPAAGAYVSQTVSFAGTASDGGSGLAAVEVSVDGGYAWRAAVVISGAWSLSWELAGPQDLASYLAQVRALDAAGNVTVQGAVITIGHGHGGGERQCAEARVDGDGGDLEPAVGGGGGERRGGDGGGVGRAQRSRAVDRHRRDGGGAGLGGRRPEHVSRAHAEARRKEAPRLRVSSSLRR